MPPLRPRAPDQPYPHCPSRLPDSQTGPHDYERKDLNANTRNHMVVCLHGSSAFQNLQSRQLIAGVRIGLGRWPPAGNEKMGSAMGGVCVCTCITVQQSQTVLGFHQTGVAGVINNAAPPPFSLCFFFVLCNIKRDGMCVISESVTLLSVTLAIVGTITVRAPTTHN